jgi:quercetin dioxygenase-like cupin family protein
MVSKRDAIVAAMSCVLTTFIVVSAQKSQTLMSSSVFNWESIPVKETKTGASRQFFRGPTATLDELECHVTTVNAGQASHAGHAHPEEELIIVKEGILESNQNGEIKRAGPGSIVFEASNQWHALKNGGPTPVTYFVIKWNSPGTLKKQ